MNKIKVLLADVSKSHLDIVSSYLALQGNIEIIGACSSGFEIISIAKSKSPDVIVMNIVIEDIYGITVLRRLQSMRSAPQVIICSEFCNELSIRSAQRAGAAAYLCKPVLLESLYNTICDCAESSASGLAEFSQPETSTDVVIMDRLAYMGISAACSGYSMIITAVKHALKEPDSLRSLSQNLYPRIADVHNTTSCRVERNIRSAIKSAFMRGTLDSNGKTLTNKQLIAKLINDIKGKSSTL